MTVAAQTVIYKLSLFEKTVIYKLGNGYNDRWSQTGHLFKFWQYIINIAQVLWDVDCGKEFILCEYNRDADSYRSPWSNKYRPALEDAPYPSSELRKLEAEAMKSLPYIATSEVLCDVNCGKEFILYEYNRDQWALHDTLAERRKN